MRRRLLWKGKMNKSAIETRIEVKAFTDLAVRSDKDKARLFIASLTFLRCIGRLVSLLRVVEDSIRGASIAQWL